MSNLGEDLRFSWRSLIKQPTFAAVAILTLALAIGANTAIFSVVDSVLLKPVPFRDPGRVVVVWGVNADFEKLIGSPDDPQSAAAFYDFQRMSTSLESAALATSDRQSLTGQGEPELLGVTKVTPDFFKVVGTPAFVGRTLDASDEQPGVALSVVFSYKLWQRRFGGDPKIVGQKVILNGKPVIVAGVMPPGFSYPLASETPAYFAFAAAPDAWMPHAHTPADHQDRGNRIDMMLARLKPGVSVAAAEQELNAICKRLAEQNPFDKGWTVRLVPITEQMTKGLRPILLTLWISVALVLLIACVNVANLLLARAASRQREIALRTALGAGRMRVISQLLVESALLAFLGGALGVFLAWGFLRLCASSIPTGLAGNATFTLDARALGFTLFLCLLTGLLAGLFPAVQMTRPDLAGALREGNRMGSGTARSRRTRGALVVAEVAIAVSVLVGAGLLLRSFSHLTAVDPGFRADNILTFRVTLPPTRPPEQLAAFYARLDHELNAIPGTTGAALISQMPMSGVDNITGIVLEGKPKPPPGVIQWVGARTVTPGYFSVLNIPLKKGRLIGAADTRDKGMVAVVDEAMVATYWPGEEAMGRRFKRLDALVSPWITVVGVVGNLRHSDLASEPRPTFFMTSDQATAFYMPPEMFGVVRTKGDPKSFSRAVRDADYAIDRNQPVAEIRPFKDVVNQSIAKNRLGLLLLGILALLALTLTIVGIYGITAYSVAQQTNEIGLRMALGAQRNQVLAYVVRNAGLLAAAGIVIGLALAFALTRLASSYLTTLLYNVTSTDPLTFVGVSVVLALVALAAAYLPGRRATRVSPIVALRTD